MGAVEKGVGAMDMDKKTQENSAEQLAEPEHAGNGPQRNVAQDGKAQQREGSGEAL
ncbi:MAG: hypothetical protein LIO46_06870 [Clostridiales bacterium]|nr:hypothetical protein [Clostridiales bacterium]